MNSEGSTGSVHSNESTPLLQTTEDEGTGFSSSSVNGVLIKPKYVLIEPVALVLCFGWSISGIVLANQIIYQTCEYLGYNKTECALLGTNEANKSEDLIALEARVQPTAAQITMVASIMISVLPALCGLLLGPWSDRFGRKPVIIIPCVGYIITYLTKAAICWQSTLVPVNPWLYAVAYLPAALTGGTSVVCAGLFSFLTDVTTEQNRTVRMGILQACTLMGAFIGMMSSSFILKMTSPVAVFLLSTLAMALAAVYVLVFIEDSVTPRVGDARSGSCRKLREIFRLDLLRDMFNTFFKARSGYDRGIIWLTVCMGAFTVLGSGGSNVFYLFTRRKFNWTLEDFTLWQSADFMAIIVGNFLGIAILKKLFKVPDIAIAFLSILCFMSDSFIKGLASQGWQLYLATGMTPLKGTEGVALMSISSSILPSHDIAKIYSMAMSITAIIPLAGAPLFTYIYSQTLDKTPELFNFVASGIYSVNLLFVGVIHILLKGRQRHHRLYNQSSISSNDSEPLA